MRSTAMAFFVFGVADADGKSKCNNQVAKAMIRHTPSNMAGTAKSLQWKLVIRSPCVQGGVAKKTSNSLMTIESIVSKASRINTTRRQLNFFGDCILRSLYREFRFDLRHRSNGAGQHRYTANHKSNWKRPSPKNRTVRQDANGDCVCYSDSRHTPRHLTQ